MGENEKTIIVDGRIIDLEKISTEDLLKIRKELEDKERLIRKEIDRLLERDKEEKNV